jgi:hypothetical protein
LSCWYWYRCKMVRIQPYQKGMGSWIQTTSYIDNNSSRRDCSTIDSRDVTTANVPDNKMYVLVTSSSLTFSLPTLRYMVADPWYDDKKLYEYSKKTLRIDLACPVKRYEITSKERLEIVCIYQSVLGKTIYNKRR